MHFERLLAIATLGATLLAGCSDAGHSPQNLACTGGPDGSPPNPLYVSLMQDHLTDADYWETEPRILAAGLGFTDIIGVPGLDSSDLDTQKSSTLAAGGAWNVVVTTLATIAQRAYTSAISPNGVENSPRRNA